MTINEAKAIGAACYDLGLSSEDASIIAAAAVDNGTWKSTPLVIPEMAARGGWREASQNKQGS